MPATPSLEDRVVPKVITKSRCCRSKKRCKNCPVVMMRLQRQGLARCREVLGKGTKARWKVSKKVTKKKLAAARSW